MSFTIVKAPLVALAGATVVTFAAVGSAQAVELVKNGGFETGDFSGWTQSGNLDFTDVVNDPSYANSGTYAAALGPVESLGFLSQTLATVAGQNYQLSYFLKSDGRAPNVFQALVDGVPLFNKGNIPVQNFTRYTFDFTAASSSTNLTFGFRNDPGYLGLDDVSVQGGATAVPTPALLPGLIGLGVSVLRKRKAEATKQEAKA